MATTGDDRGDFEQLERLGRALRLIKEEHSNLNTEAILLFILIAGNEHKPYEFFINSTGLAKSAFTKYVARLAGDSEKGAGLVSRSLMPGSAVERILYLTGKGRSLAKRLAEVTR